MLTSISIPYNKNYPGGPGAFIENISIGLEDIGMQVTNKFYKGQVIIVIVYYNIFKLLIAKYLLRKKIILRLDGAYIFLKSSLKIKLQFYATYLIYKFLADGIIFQGNFSKLSIIDVFGESYKKNKVILNGVKALNIKPRNLEKKVDQIKLVYWANSLNLDNFKNAKIILEQLQKTNPIEFYIIGGNLKNDEHLMISSSIKGLNYLGNLDRREIYKIGEQFDIFIMFKGSTCPNALLEANSMGIPVVTPNLGGNKELIIEESGVVFQTKNKLPKGNEFIEPIQVILKDLSYYKSKAYKNHKKNFTHQIMTENYLSFIKEILIK